MFTLLARCLLQKVRCAKQRFGWVQYGLGYTCLPAGKCSLLSYKVRGQRSDQYIATVDEQKHVPRIRLLTIWFGANDSCIKPSPQHVPLDKFTENIRTMVQMITSPSSAYYCSDTKIILITPPPVNTIQRGADLASRNPPLALDRKFDVTKLYAEAVKSVAGQEKVALLDVWTMFWEAAGSEELLSKYLSDGLHPSALGYDVRARTLSACRGILINRRSWCIMVLSQRLPKSIRNSTTTKSNLYSLCECVQI